jgi:hypothetical protein
MSYDLTDAEKMDKAKAAKLRVSDLLPAEGEARPFWVVRALSAAWRWLKSPARRIKLGAMAVAGCLLCQGCATSGPRVAGAALGCIGGGIAVHNYLVAESERAEKEMVAEGLVPLRQSNWDLIRENAWLYLGGIGAGGATGWIVTDWAIDSADGGDVVNNTTNNDNRTLPTEPVGVEPQGNAGEE